MPPVSQSRPLPSTHHTVIFGYYGLIKQDTQIMFGLRLLRKVNKHGRGIKPLPNMIHFTNPKAMIMTSIGPLANQSSDKDRTLNTKKLYSRSMSNAKIPKPNNKTGIIASLGIGASLLLGKTKYVLVALKLTKAAPLVSMVISSLAYSMIFGLPYAVGMVGLIFVHECGHAAVMHRYGVPFSPMVFIPFMGAVVAMKNDPRSCYEEAIIAFGGPVAGSLAAVGVGAVGAMYDSQLLYALADFGLMINLFNLLPIGSLDGGRIGNAVSPWVGVAGLGAGGLMIYANAVHNPIFYLIMLGGTYSSVSRLMGWEDRPNKDYYNIPRADQAKLFAGYVGLVAALIAAMQVNNLRRKSPNQIKAQESNPYGEYSDFDWPSEGQQHGSDGVYDDYFGKEFK